MRVKLATYNIHASIGADGQFKPARIAQVLNELNADVVALQEVEHHNVEGCDLLEYLAIETESSAIAGPTLLRDTRRYGNALLTKLPAISDSCVDLSVPGREPRCALNVRFDWNGLRVLVVATHLGLKSRERRLQVRRLLTLFDSESFDIAILMGDINEWFLWGRPLRKLHENFKHSPACATYPACWPFLSLDRIWVRPRNLLESVKTHDTPTARIASDHLPLKAIIEF